MSALAEQTLRDGHLDEALAGLQQQVRERPADPTLRIFLFQLLCVLGQWERALTQLQLAGELDAGALAMVQTYREALRCERLRERVFQGQHTPLLFGEPQAWMALLVESLRLLAEGHYREAAPLRERAFEQAPATAGRIGEQGFEWIADADTRLGPMLEAFVNGAYYWIPFQYVRAIHTEAPADLRDLVWLPAQLLWSNGGESVALIPARYPGSAEHTDPQIRLARKTEWTEPGYGACLGLGQRMFATDTGDWPLFELRQIDLGAAGG